MLNRRQFSVLGAASIALAALPASAQPAAPPPNAPAAGPSAEAIAAAVQRFYNSTKTYRANFHQRYYIHAYDRNKDSRGEVVFAKPGKMRWSYKNNHNVVVSDGKKIKVYEEENHQMYIQSVSKAQYPAALSFLMGEGDLTKAFTLTKLDSARLKFPGGYVLSGQPRESTTAYQRVLFYIDAKTYQVRRVLLLDAQKNRNRFDFVGAEVNKSVPASQFSFAPPKGTRIIKP